MKDYNTSSGAKARRVRTIERLEAQLKRGTKPEGTKNAWVDLSIEVPLKATDIIRIKKELFTLKERV